jgi:hypothetical protein
MSSSLEEQREFQKTTPTRRLLVRWLRGGIRGDGGEPSLAELFRLFEPFGALESLWLAPRAKDNYALVSFRSFAMAKQAVEALDGRPLPERDLQLAIGYSEVRPVRCRHRRV